MKKGFTILELLIASLILGILVTTTTAVFNQCAIAWRIGISGANELDDVRDNVAELREEADNVYIWEGTLYKLLTIWQESGELRTRAISVEGNFATWEGPNFFKEIGVKKSVSQMGLVPVGAGSSVRSHNYSINVKSAGPDLEFGTWDDIWSFPDDFE